MKDSSKWMVRTLIIVGIGIPVILELTTLLGLIGSHMDSDELPGNRAKSAQSKVVTPNTELLPGTPMSEVLSSASVSVGSESWQFEIVLTLSELKGISRYTLQLDSLMTRDGTLVQNSFKWNQEPVADDTTLNFNAQWELPPGEQPDAVTLRTIYHTEGDSITHNVHRRLVFDKVPVQGGN